MRGRIQVPKFVVDAVHNALASYPVAANTGHAAKVACEAFAKALAENPIVPTDGQVVEVLKASGYGSESRQFGPVLVQWQRHMFETQEPEVAKNLPCPLCACPWEKLSPKHREDGTVERLTCTHCKTAFYAAGDRDLMTWWDHRESEHNRCEVCAPELEVPGNAVSLRDCPIGLFRSARYGTLSLKTEYGLDCYIVSSGERFWGGAKSEAELAEVMVIPIVQKPDLSRFSAFDILTTILDEARKFYSPEPEVPERIRHLIANEDAAWPPSRELYNECVKDAYRVGKEEGKR